MAGANVDFLGGTKLHRAELEINHKEYFFRSGTRSMADAVTVRKESCMHYLLGQKAACVADLLLLGSRKSLWSMTELWCHLLIQILGLEA